MTRIATIIVVGLLIANALWIVWYFPTEGWRIVWFPVVSVLLAWSVIRDAYEIAHDEVINVVDRAKELEKTDPAAALDLLDAFFIARQEPAAQQRAELWESASHDRRAAIKLQRLLKEELRGHDLMRRKSVAAAPPEQRAAGEEMVENAERRTRDDLERIRAILKQLKP